MLNAKLKEEAMKTENTARNVVIETVNNFYNAVHSIMYKQDDWK
jgi:hypothetical protein